MLDCLHCPFCLSIAGRKEKAASGMFELVIGSKFCKFFGSELGAFVTPENLCDSVSSKCCFECVVYTQLLLISTCGPQSREKNTCSPLSQGTVICSFEVEEFGTNYLPRIFWKGGRDERFFAVYGLFDIY